jgi:hypothetical protein
MFNPASTLPAAKGVARCSADVLPPDLRAVPLEFDDRHKPALNGARGMVRLFNPTPEQAGLFSEPSLGRPPYMQAASVRALTSGETRDTHTDYRRCGAAVWRRRILGPRPWLLVRLFFKWTK